MLFLPRMLSKIRLFAQGELWPDFHANLGKGVEHEFEIMKDRIRSLHLHDNDGIKDSHVFPFAAEGGTINWAHVMELLRSLPHACPLMLELKELPELQYPLDRVNEIFEKLEQA